MRKILPALIVMLLFAPIARGQSVEEVQDTMLQYIASINRLDTIYGIDERFDSLQAYDKRLLDYLTVALIKVPATLTYDFPKLKNTGIGILTSEDNKFRIYYWDIGGGAGSHSCDVLVQYKGTTGTKVKALSDVSKMEEGEVSSGLSYGDLITLKTKLGKTVYLAVGGQKISMGLYVQSIQAFSINTDSLDDTIKFFQTSKKLVNTIDYSFERTLLSGNDPSVVISADKQKISIPIITGEGKTTSKHLVNKFDGNKYVYDKNSK